MGASFGKGVLGRLGRLNVSGLFFDLGFFVECGELGGAFFFEF